MGQVTVPPLGGGDGHGGGGDGHGGGGGWTRGGGEGSVLCMAVGWCWAASFGWLDLNMVGSNRAPLRLLFEILLVVVSRNHTMPQVTFSLGEPSLGALPCETCRFEFGQVFTSVHVQAKNN